MRLFIMLTASHGFRFNEARTFTLGMYCRQTKSITHPTKGHDTNTVPATDELQNLLESFPPNTDTATPVILLLPRPAPATARPIYDEWKKTLKRAGANPHLHIHDLRRTLAVRAYDATKDLRTVQQLLGHRNLQTTCLYLEHRDTAATRPLLNSLTNFTARSIRPN